MGLGWMAALATLVSDHVALSYVFVLATGMQGVLIFYFHCVRDPGVRSLLASKCRTGRRAGRAAGTSSSSKSKASASLCCLPRPGTAGKRLPCKTTDSPEPTPSPQHPSIQQQLYLQQLQQLQPQSRHGWDTSLAQRRLVFLHQQQQRQQLEQQQLLRLSNGMCVAEADADADADGEGEQDSSILALDVDVDGVLATRYAKQHKQHKQEQEETSASSHSTADKEAGAGRMLARTRQKQAARLRHEQQLLLERQLLHPAELEWEPFHAPAEPGAVPIRSYRSSDSKILTADMFSRTPRSPPGSVSAMPSLPSSPSSVFQSSTHSSVAAAAANTAAAGGGGSGMPRTAAATATATTATLSSTAAGHESILVKIGRGSGSSSSNRSFGNSSSSSIGRTSSGRRRIVPGSTGSGLSSSQNCSHSEENSHNTSHSMDEAGTSGCEGEGAGAMASSSLVFTFPATVVLGAAPASPLTSMASFTVSPADTSVSVNRSDLSQASSSQASSSQASSSLFLLSPSTTMTSVASPPSDTVVVDIVGGGSVQRRRSIVAWAAEGIDEKEEEEVDDDEDDEEEEEEEVCEDYEEGVCESSV